MYVTSNDSVSGMIRSYFAVCVLLCRESLATDKRAQPRAGERVPYVVVYGTPGSPIIDLVRR